MRLNRYLTGGLPVLLFCLSACAIATIEPGASVETATSVASVPAATRTAAEILGPPFTPHSTVPGGNLQATGLPGQDTPEAPAGSGQLPEAVQATVMDLSRALSLPMEEITVLSHEATQWSDSCLGLASPDEMCLQVITPGWRVILEVGSQQFEYHTDETGERVRLKPALVP